MPYSDFTIETVESRLGLPLTTGELFPNSPLQNVPGWLPETLTRNRGVMPLNNEKARSEAIVSPILMAAAEATHPHRTVFSGHRLDVDPQRGLVGECDFLLAKSQPLPRIRGPLMSVVEAKNADIDLGLGQCIAQMEGARLFNLKAGVEYKIFGCVTTGELWQFLRHDETIVVLDTKRYTLEPLERLLGVFHLILN